jgi:hypothetical protein
MNPYIAQFSKELLEKKAGILYDGYLRADKPVTYQHHVRLWAESGCYRVRLGIESASARVLDSMNKMTKPQVISDVLKALAGAGIRTTTYWIVGFPGETEQDFEETCDFIRRHHRYIYELEAHPHYYYPYGQIGSRLHQSYSLYPEEVSNIIKFKVWEILDADPTREERYRRLRKISALAAKLGLPNIYTMTERYQAEERWHLLYPLSVEVYEGTRVCRKKAQPFDHPIELPPGVQSWLAELMTISQPLMPCYEVSVGRSLQQDTLAAAIVHLINYNEMLQVRLDGGRDLSTPVDIDRPNHGSQMLSIYHNTVADRERAEVIKRQVIEAVSPGLKPEPGRSLRFALIDWGGETATLLLFAHPALIDRKSMILLFEDLYRLYEQLSNKRPISLRPAPKSYFEFARAAVADSSSRIDSPADGGKPVFNAAPLRGGRTGDLIALESRRVESGAMVIGKEAVSKLASARLADYGLKVNELFVLAFLRSLAMTCQGENLRAYLVYDYRSYNSELEFALGPLTGLCLLPSDILENESPSSSLRCLRRALARTDSGHLNFRSRFSPSSGPAEGVTLNLEYLNPEPWMGGSEWVPEGFAIDKSRPPGDYAIQLTPYPLKDEIRIRLAYRNTARLKKLSEAVAGSVVAEFHALVDYFERHASEVAFWSEEFNGEIPGSNLEWGSDNGPIAGTEQGWIHTAVEKESLAALQTECRVDLSAVLLAAFAALLSRLNGRESMILISRLSDGEGAKIIPLRLNSHWDLSVREFTRRVAQKLELAATYSADAFDILSHEISEPGRERPVPTFDVGYIFTRNTGRETLPLEGLFAPYPETPGLLLEASQAEHDLTVRLVYDGGRCHEGMASQLAAYLSAFLTEASNWPDAQLCDVRLGRDLIVDDSVNSLLQASFRF